MKTNKLTKSQIRQIIKEEKQKIINESQFLGASRRPFNLTDLQIAFIRHCAGAYAEVGLDDMLGEYPDREQIDEILELTKLG